MTLSDPACSICERDAVIARDDDGQRIWFCAAHVPARDVATVRNRTVVVSLEVLRENLSRAHLASTPLIDFQSGSDLTLLKPLTQHCLDLSGQFRSHPGRCSTLCWSALS